MPRSIVLGNGKTLVGIDRLGQVRDLYFPKVGLEDQVRGHYLHKMGVWVDGSISWFDGDSRWNIEVLSDENSLASNIIANNDGIGIKLIFKDVVYNESSVFLRKVEVLNNQSKSREIKVYFGQQFELYKSHGADTAYFDPDRHAIVHYKGQRVFMINGEMEGLPFTDYTIGLANFQGHEGSHRDADDGSLTKNPIEHGPVDSVVGFYGFYSGGETKIIHYWLIGGTSVDEVIELNATILKKTPDHVIKTTCDYWNAWVNKYEFTFFRMSPASINLFKKSLMIMRAHVDDGGAIIASSDSDMLNQGKDTYAYMWPRDAGFSAVALDRAGDQNVAQRFFTFCRDVISKDGYFMHKYLPDKSIGSSWHPWVRDGVKQLPIQEDETAIVIWALYEHYMRGRDLEFVEELFNTVIERAADFMVSYRDKKTGLPKPSYDLWEEKYGVHTFTAASVFGALMAAANFSHILGKTNHEENYRKAANEVRDGIMKYLYDENSGHFLKSIIIKDKEIIKDSTVDMSSVYGIHYFSVLPSNDQRLKRAFDQTRTQLSRNISVGGIARYEGDYYYKIVGDTAGNPWIITTLWAVEYDISLAQTEKEFEAIRSQLDWVAKFASPSGILSEQLNPHNGAQVSASPLTWSHAQYVNTVLKYLDRLDQLGICSVCNPVP